MALDKKGRLRPSYVLDDGWEKTNKEVFVIQLQKSINGPNHENVPSLREVVSLHGVSSTAVNTMAVGKGMGNVLPLNPT